MMPPKDKKSCCLTIPLSVLSNLPENVIDVILMFLPFRDAVRTSILSNIWRNKWCRLPDLTLDKHVWKTEKNVILGTSEIAKIISHILILHAGPITKFVLCVPESRSCLMIDDLIYFLSKNGIQHLVLRIPFRNDEYKLPSSFFVCLQLRHLTLQNCLILPPPAFKGFDRLISLELCEVTISSKFLESLISHCLFLEHLVLHTADSDRNVIEINAPRLRTFYFEGSVRAIFLKNIPLLAKFSLTDNGTCYLGDEKWDIVRFFESFSTLEHLILDYRIFSEEDDNVPTRLPFTLNSVKRVHINVYMYDSVEVSCALFLIRSFPYLQYMEIQEPCCNDDMDDPDLDDHQVELPSDVTFNHLKEVKLILCTRSIIEMRLPKFLLAKSPVLVRMLIESWLVQGSLTVQKIVAELTNFQRASPKVEVFFSRKLV